MDLDLKNTRTTLLNSDLFYDILELNLRSTWTTLLDYGCSYILKSYWTWTCKKLVLRYCIWVDFIIHWPWFD